MYKFIGFGLLGFLALLIIPVSSSTQSDDPSMYGMATVSIKDESGNVLIENQMHNEVVDQGTAYMLDHAFKGGTNPDSPDGPGVNGLCVSNAISFSTADSETIATFNTANTIGNPFTNCHEILSFNPATQTFISTSSTFSAGTAFADSTTITGIGVCSVPGGSGSSLDCSTVGSINHILFSVIDIPDTTVGSGSQLDVTYTLNLD
jgi:hypothetical protein